MNESEHDWKYLTNFPNEVPTGTLVLADKTKFTRVGFCRTCKYKDTPQCNMACYGSKHHDVYVSGAFPWDCIFCCMKNGKAIKDFERDHTYACCPHIHNVTDLDDDDKAKAKKWGCTAIDIDGKRGNFCRCAVRQISVRDSLGTDYIFEGACAHYEPIPHAAHASALWSHVDESLHPMGFKCVREYAKELDCQTLYDLLFKLDIDEFREFCRKHKFKNVNRVMWMIEDYAEVFGWFSIGGHQAYLEGTIDMQTIRVRKAVAALANAKAREMQSKKEGEKK